MLNNIEIYEFNVMSQNGEDGIIEEIFNRIGTTNKYFVEFGISDGRECNTGYLARHKGWSGLMIEGNFFYYRKACRFYKKHPIKIIHSWITKDNINELFTKGEVPKELDLLSIDIDGNDYWIWGELINYKPRVVVIEYNAYHVPPKKWVMAYNEHHKWDGTTHFGASLTSYSLLGKKLGYSLIGTDKKGVNAFFIRNDQLEKSNFIELPPEAAYNNAKYGAINGNHPYRNGEFLEI
ncbi:hypothetical protein [Pelotomaculum propionicicum]|uniref:Methyltransferase FkbM domain-containing protein n=1 Tax=Pelotomaculum propionicicum TaxID=258475 RepID=A0A4Y7RCJ7_9FIRM|nr:hypothetical protein [Pelotomaculum propionicicum]NLI14431.1 hypothetical protein [Peptococcaceae bacterium]TEB06450.1 hypothetical protein Pmgp_03722 [Pelotomaculum propionicicum]